MIYKTIQKKFMPICVGLALPLMLSCDSDSGSGSGSGSAGEDDIALKPTLKAEVLDFYLLGDLINYRAVEGLGVDGISAALVNDSTFNSANAADLNQVETNPHVFPMLFTKTADYEFQLQGNSQNRGRAFEDAIRILIGNPADLGSEFRQRLLDPHTNTPTFTRDELAAMVIDINASNPEGKPIVYLLPDRNIIVDLTFCTFTISHTSTSLNEDLLSGAMDGSYTVDVTDARTIEFRRPTDAEIINFNWGIRGFTPSYWLPILGANRADIKGIQTGFYTMSLGNTPIGPVR